MNPDRISEYSRGNRQQEAFYDTKSWQESLGGKGIKRSGEEIEEGEGGEEVIRKKRPSAKEVVSYLHYGTDRICFCTDGSFFLIRSINQAQFKQNKVDKKRRNLTAFLA